MSKAEKSSGVAAKRKAGGKPFTKGQSGNPNGKPPGTKSERLKQWEALGEFIQGQHAEEFNGVLHSLFSSSEMHERVSGAELYLKVLEYFKPKLARTEMKAPPGTEVTYTLKFK